MANLYELSREYAELADIAALGADSEQEMLDIVAKLNQIDASIDEKVANGIAVIRTLQNLVDGTDQEIVRLKERKQAFIKREDQIKSWYLQNIEILGRKKVDTSLGSMSIRNNPPRLTISNESQIPEEYKVEIPAHFEIDKARIKDDLKRGKEVPGCCLESSKGLIIR